MEKKQMVVDVFNKYAQLYQDKYMDVEQYRESFDLFCQHIKKSDAEILEIACGPGNITRYLLNKRPDLKILGIDLATNMIDLAKANNPTADFQVMDGRDIVQLNKTFDAIICGFCLPYLSKEEAIKLIGDASKILNTKGVFYFSTVEDDYKKSGLKASSVDPRDVTYMYYHQADYLTQGLTQNGFEILDLRRESYPASDGNITTDLLIIARKL